MLGMQGSYSTLAATSQETQSQAAHHSNANKLFKDFLSQSDIEPQQVRFNQDTKDGISLNPVSQGILTGRQTSLKTPLANISIINNQNNSSHASRPLTNLQLRAMTSTQIKNKTSLFSVRLRPESCQADDQSDRKKFQQGNLTIKTNADNSLNRAKDTSKKTQQS